MEQVKKLKQLCDKHETLLKKIWAAVSASNQLELEKYEKQLDRVCRKMDMLGQELKVRFDWGAGWQPTAYINDKAYYNFHDLLAALMPPKPRIIVYMMNAVRKDRHGNYQMSSVSINAEYKGDIAKVAKRFLCSLSDDMLKLWYQTGVCICTPYLFIWEENR